jgi:hypothetical protein
MSKLPAGFQELERYVDKWARPEFMDRYAARATSPFAEVSEFYHAVLPRMDDIMQHIDQYPMDAMPQDAFNLAHLAMSFMVVSPAVELFDQSDVPWGFDWQRMHCADLGPGLGVAGA